MLGPSSWRIGCVDGDGQEDGRWTSAAGRGGAGASRSYGAGEEAADEMFLIQRKRPGEDFMANTTARAVLRKAANTSAARRVPRRVGLAPRPPRRSAPPRSRCRWAWFLILHTARDHLRGSRGSSLFSQYSKKYKKHQHRITIQCVHLLNMTRDASRRGSRDTHPSGRGSAERALLIVYRKIRDRVLRAN